MSLRKRLFGLATALAVGLLGLAGAGSASAAIAEWNSLTVHKYLGATTNLKHDGTAIDAGELAGKTPLEGLILSCTGLRALMFLLMMV